MFDRNNDESDIDALECPLVDLDALEQKLESEEERLGDTGDDFLDPIDDEEEDPSLDPYYGDPDDMFDDERDNFDD